MNNGKIRFVAGDGSPRQFAQKCVNKLNEEEFENLPYLEEEQTEMPIQENPPEDCEDKKEKLPLRHGRMCFNEGSCGEIEEELEEETQMRTQQNRPPQRPQSAADMAKDIYNKMRVLGELYQDLVKFRTSYSDELREMINELNVVTFAMGRIYQTLSRSNRLPIQNQQKPRITVFCGGLLTTSRYLREIMSDLRRLQRAVDNQNISVQLLIINITLMEQQQDLAQMMQSCQNPRQ